MVKCMSLHHMYAYFLQRPAVGITLPGTGVPNSCEPPYGCWKLNPDILWEQLVVLATEPPLQSLVYVCVCVIEREKVLLPHLPILYHH